MTPQDEAAMAALSCQMDPEELLVTQMAEEQAAYAADAACDCCEPDPWWPEMREEIRRAEAEAAGVCAAAISGDPPDYPAMIAAVEGMYDWAPLERRAKARWRERERRWAPLTENF